MGLRDTLVEIARSRAEGRVTFDSRGGSTYHPPGSSVRVAGDWLALAGGMCHLIMAAGASTLVTAGGAGYPLVYPGNLRMNAAILGGAPLVGAVVAWACLLIGGWRSRLVVAGIGAVGTAVAWPLLQRLLAWATLGSAQPPSVGVTAGVVGSLALLGGGVLGATAAYFPEWAVRLDDESG